MLPRSTDALRHPTNRRNRQANFLQWSLMAISALNAFYTMTRTRHYRFFEMNVEAAGPGTPSAPVSYTHLTLPTTERV